MKSYIAFIRWCAEYYELKTGGIWSLCSKARKRAFIHKEWREWSDSW